ncbi:hypothetical protein PLICRDRAFT_53990 [Plicaturopsis crispa FD-325 SS-3]|nr:hypothetical protein PLICRDRAFT_53990 [Plicaturopsis crispa FD-325 SS-3]
MSVPALVSLLLVAPALAAVPTISQLGPTSLLYQNDLSFNASQSALLLHDQQSFTQANASCHLTNEQLLSNVTADVRAQLRYLEFDQQVSTNATYWVASASAGNATCSAYSFADDKLVSADCATQLPVLCTQSAAPYTYGQNATAGTEVQVEAQGYGASPSSFYTGFRDARSFRFLGIPFAAPPLGDLRFAPPAPYTGSKNISALAFGPACMQDTTSTLGLPDEVVSEDCLTLNVFTPSVPAGPASGRKLKPVAFWIYGGSFATGSGSDEIFDGGNMAARGDVVIVTSNYRVGILGSLATATALNGSQSIRDQIAALNWVQENIAAFGGDPNHVTIFGQSAGAQGVVALLASSSAHGLFSAAIVQSAPVDVPFHIRDVHAKAIAPAVATALQCPTSPEADTVACLRAAPASSFVSKDVVSAASNASAQANAVFDPSSTILESSEPFRPVVGGAASGVVDDQLAYELGNSTLPGRVPLLIGTVRDEATMFVENPKRIVVPQSNSTELYEEYITKALGNQTAELVINSGLFPMNTSDPNGVANGLSQILTLQQYECPIQEFITAAHNASTFPKVYAYRFDKGVAATSAWPDACRSPDNISGVQRICHAMDLTEVFGTSNIVGNPFGDLNVLTYNQYVSDTWISFIREYDPNPSADYLNARGRSYETTLAYVAQTPLQPFDPSSAQAIHHFDAPPSSSGLEAADQCALFAKAGSLVDHIDNSY